MQAMLLRQHPHSLAGDALGRIHHVAGVRVWPRDIVASALLKYFAVLGNDSVKRGPPVKNRYSTD